MGTSHWTIAVTAGHRWAERNSLRLLRFKKTFGGAGDRDRTGVASLGG